MGDVWRRVEAWEEVGVADEGKGRGLKGRGLKGRGGKEGEE